MASLVDNSHHLVRPQQGTPEATTPSGIPKGSLFVRSTDQRSQVTPTHVSVQSSRNTPHACGPETPGSSVLATLSYDPAKRLLNTPKNCSPPGPRQRGAQPAVFPGTASLAEAARAGQAEAEGSRAPIIQLITHKMDPTDNLGFLRR